MSASGSAGVCATGRRRWVERESPTALHANRSDMFSVVREHVHGAALGGRAQNFPFATSRNASLTNSASANNRFKRAFCSRSSLSSLAASVSIPP